MRSLYVKTVPSQRSTKAQPSDDDHHDDDRGRGHGSDPRVSLLSPGPLVEEGEGAEVGLINIIIKND